MALLFGGMTASYEVFTNPAPQVCDTTKPCLYTGNAVNQKGVGIHVSVYYSKDGNRVLASFVSRGVNQVVYCFQVGNSSRWYFNWDGDKWYFNM